MSAAVVIHSPQKFVSLVMLVLALVEVGLDFS